MKLIQPSFEIIKQNIPVIKLDKDQYFLIGEYLEAAKKQIELAGRVCYKSEDKITEDSYKSFFDMLRSKQHMSVLEHGTLYFKITVGNVFDDNYLWKAQVVSMFRRSPFSKVIERRERLSYDNETTAEVTSFYITANYRDIEENFKNIPENKLMAEISKKTLFKYLCNPTEHHAKRISVKFICSRSIAQQLTRHRAFSFSMESQRYCNYSKDKFGNEITFIEPEGFSKYPKFKEALESAEQNYFYLLGLGVSPQLAREVLPNATKTELFMTGFEDDWKQFLKLRTEASAHPEMRRLVNPLKDMI